jgi:hypothetical protein
MVTVRGNLVWGNVDFEECFVALRMSSVCYPLENSLEWHSEVSIYWFNYVIFVETSTSESDKGIDNRARQLSAPEAR